MALTVQPGDVAAELGVDSWTLTPAQEAKITRKIRAAEAAVMNHLNRDSLEPRQETLTDLTPDSRYPVDDWRAWARLMDRFDDMFTVTSATLQPDGSYTVEFAVGLDAANTPAVADYVLTHAAEATAHDPTAGIGQRRVESYSAEGQSIRYTSAPASGGRSAAGALPTLDSLNRWRRHAAYRSNRPPQPPWPSTHTPVGWNPR